MIIFVAKDLEYWYNSIVKVAGQPFFKTSLVHSAGPPERSQMVWLALYNGEYLDASWWFRSKQGEINTKYKLQLVSNKVGTCQSMLPFLGPVKTGSGEIDASNPVQSTTVSPQCRNQQTWGSCSSPYFFCRCHSSLLCFFPFSSPWFPSSSSSSLFLQVILLLIFIAKFTY